MQKNGLDIKPIVWRGSVVQLIDQTKLPDRIEVLTLTDSSQVIFAIKNLKVRGAPAIGIAGACAIALAAQQIKRETDREPPGTSDANSFEQLAVFQQKVASIADQITLSRPTAINLEWAVSRMMSLIYQSDSISATVIKLSNKAFQMIAEDISANLSLSHYGSALIEKHSSVLTHCNAGALATAGHGTGLGIIKSAWESGKTYQSLSRKHVQFSKVPGLHLGS
jgi:methylthioribose-1-phosphate isomerase